MIQEKRATTFAELNASEHGSQGQHWMAEQVPGQAWSELEKANDNCAKRPRIVAGKDC